MHVPLTWRLLKSVLLSSTNFQITAYQDTWRAQHELQCPHCGLPQSYHSKGSWYSLQYSSGAPAYPLVDCCLHLEALLSKWWQSELTWWNYSQPSPCNQNGWNLIAAAATPCQPVTLFSIGCQCGVNKHSQGEYLEIKFHLFLQKVLCLIHILLCWNLARHEINCMVFCQFWRIDFSIGVGWLVLAWRFTTSMI